MNLRWKRKRDGSKILQAQYVHKAGWHNVPTVKSKPKKKAETCKHTWAITHNSDLQYCTKCNAKFHPVFGVMADEMPKKKAEAREFYVCMEGSNIYAMRQKAIDPDIKLGANMWWIKVREVLSDET